MKTTNARTHAGICAVFAFICVGAGCKGKSTALARDGGTGADSGGTFCNSVADDFAPSGVSPAGAWSYGWSVSLSSPFMLYTKFGNGLAGNSDSAEQIEWTPAAADYPIAWLNPTDMVHHPGGTTTLEPHQFALHPGQSGEYSIARWTAPLSGNVSVQAFFDGVAGYAGSGPTTTDVHVRHNGVDLAAGQINLAGAGNSFVYESSVDIAAHDTIDFLVGYGNGNFFSDSTALDAIICN